MFYLSRDELMNLHFDSLLCIAYRKMIKDKIHIMLCVSIFIVSMLSFE